MDTIFIGFMIMADLFWLFLTWPYGVMVHFFWNDDPYRQMAVYGISIPATLAWIGFLIWGISKL